MTISVDAATRIITVPLADLTLVSGSNYTYDADVFRLELKDWEDSTEGIELPATHRHNTTTTLSGVTYARTLEIINGFTVTFEDGNYSVSITGANHNIGDVKNVNSVSLVIGNSAGLIQVTQGSGLSVEQAEQLEQLWQDRGFDASNIVTVNESAGTISVAGTIRTWAGTVIKTLTRTT